MVETRLVDTEFPESFGGTLDFCRVTEQYIHVYDLKTGRVDVNVNGNEQLASYLLLARQKFGPRERYYGTIVQPRLNYKATAEFHIDALLEVDRRIRECIGDDTRVAGIHCEHCPLLGECSVAHDRAVELVPILRPQNETDLPPDLAADRRLVEFSRPIEKLVERAKDRLKAHVEKGKPVRGWKVSHRKGPRSLGKPEQFADWLDTLGLADDILEELKKPSDWRTIAQMEKVLPVPIPEQFIEYGKDSLALLCDKKIDRAEIFVDEDLDVFPD